MFSLVHSNKSPRLRLRSLSIGRSSSSGSLTGDETFTVETLQLSRFEVTQDVPECEPDYGPAVRYIYDYLLL